MEIDIPYLIRLRQFSGRSIRQLAKEAGVSHSHLAYIETGKREPGEGIVKKLADALDVSVEELVRG